MSESKDNDERVNMDAILDAALDELDDDDDDGDGDDENDVSNPTQETPSSDKKAGNKPTVVKASDENVVLEEELNQLDGMMKEILSATNGTEPDEAFGAVMAKLQQQMAAEMESAQREDSEKKEKSAKKSTSQQKNDDTETKKPASSRPAPPPKNRPVFGPEPPPTESDVDRTISKLLNDMASASIEDPSVDNDMDDMMKEFETLGGEDMIDGMMQQMLAKDLMYEPMKEVAAKFPKWLEDNKNSIPKEEHASRCKQYEGLQELIAVYETEPDNADKLMELMKEVQEFGLPPSDIVASIAPDLELDEDGVPQLKSMQDCCIM